MLRLNIELHSFNKIDAKKLSGKLTKEIIGTYLENFTVITIFNSECNDCQQKPQPFIRLTCNGLDECYSLVNKLPDPLVEIKQILAKLKLKAIRVEVIKLDQVFYLD